MIPANLVKAIRWCRGAFGQRLKRPQPTGSTIDYTTTYWGHNLSFRPSKEHGQYRGACWASPRPKVGDTILWKTNYGTAEAIVLSVEYCLDPDDMAFIDVEVIRRHEA